MSKIEGKWKGLIQELGKNLMCLNEYKKLIMPISEDKTETCSRYAVE